MNRFFDKLVSAIVIMGVVLTAPLTYAFVNTMTRADTISVVLVLPDRRKPVVTMWDAIDNDVGLGDSPSWYVDYEAESYMYDVPSDVYFADQVFTDEDRVCMAKNIYFEARNESLKGQMAIALVTLQRVRDPRYPDTVCGVVYDSKQFSWYWDGLSDSIRNYTSYDDIALLASAMLDTDTAMFDFTYGSTHYHANYVDPYWTEFMVYKATIDTHLFYYEPPKLYTASL